MVSRNTAVTVICVLLATALFVTAQGPWFSLTDFQLIVVVIAVGVVAPLAINHSLDSNAADA